MDGPRQPAARLARALADETRLRILASLTEREATVTDLAEGLGVAQPRVSTHLARLRAVGLVSAAAAGRHRTYRVDRARAAALLAALGAAAPPAMGRRRSPAASRQVRADTALRRARTCYDHLAGVAGVGLLDDLLQRRWLRPQPGARPSYGLTAEGERALQRRGIDVARVRASRRTFAPACLDWTERRPHLGGALGAALLASLERARRVRRKRTSRVVALIGSARHVLPSP